MQDLNNNIPRIILLLLVVIIVGIQPFCRKNCHCSVSVDEKETCSPKPEKAFDAEEVKYVALEILKARTINSSYRIKIVASEYLKDFAMVQNEEIYALSDETINKGNILDKMTLLASVVKKNELNDSDRAILKALLAEKAYAIKERAFYHLSLKKDASWVDFFRKALNDEDYYIRTSAAKALGRNGDKSSVPLLKEKMNKEEGWTKLCFAEGLAMLGDKEGINILRETSENSASPKMRSYALGMRLEAGDKSVLNDLKAQMKHKDDRAREISFRYLAKFADNQDYALFSDIIANGDFPSAIEVLEKIKTLENDKKLIVFSESIKKSNDRRKGLLKILGSERNNYDSIINLVNDSHLEDYFAGLVENLYIIDPGKGKLLLESVFLSKNLNNSSLLKEKLIDVIGKTGEQAMLPILSGCISDKDNEIRFRASLAILSILKDRKNQEK